MKLITKVEKILNSIVLAVGLTVLLAWIFEIKAFTNLVPGAATMKFNTALLFVLAALSLYFSRNNKHTYKWAFYSTIFPLLFIALYSFSEYFVPSLPDIDNTVITDRLSPVQIGRMSLATATCFTLFGLGSLFAQKKQLERMAHYSFVVILYIAIVSAIAYLLVIPLSSRPTYFKTMAIHTSVLFVFLAYISLVRQSSSQVVIFLYSKYAGSRMLRASLPLVIVLPILFNFILIHVIRENPDSTAFTIVAGTIVFISVGIIYLSFTAKILNDADRKRRRLDHFIQMRDKHQLQQNMVEETHHRVKNNFQLVSSMLQLQAYQVENQNLTGILMDCKDRLGAMAALHENIYKYGGFDSVDIRYFLNDIIEANKKSYLNKRKVEFAINITHQHLNVKQAIPLGLILNEVITNSIKHAFPNEKAGKIAIHLNHLDKQNIGLSIRDNGIGFEVEKVEKGSMGSNLIELFTRQLEGKITLKSVLGEGTSYLLTFPLLSDEYETYISKSA